MTFNYEVALREDAFVRSYMARILGYDPKYRYKRGFLKCDYSYNKDKTVVFFDYEIKEYGVYERSVKYFDTSTKKLLSKEREVYAFYDGEMVEIDEFYALTLCRRPQYIVYFLDDYCIEDAG